MPAVSRELSVAYGTITVGGASSIYLLDGPVSIDEGPDEINVSFRFSMVAANEADFDSQIAALETAFRTPRQNLTITQGAAQIYPFSHSGNTGFDAEPVIRKLTDDLGDSGRSRSYEVSIRLGAPADVYAQSGRRHARVAFDYTPGRRRTISFSGEWVVQAGGSAARVSYLAGVSTYCTGALPAGTWELIDEQHDENETNKVLTWRRTYGEIIANQSAAGLDHAAIVDPQVTYVLGRRWPTEPVGASIAHPGETSISYSCWVDKDVSTALATLWTGTIRPFLLSTAATLAGVAGSAQAVMDESPTFDTYQNRISASMSLYVYYDTGRRNTVAALAYTPSRRRSLTLSGEWVDQAGGATARSSYDSGIDAYAATFTSALEGTWELVDESFDQNETDRVISWRRVYREIVADQSAGGADDPSVVEPQLTITVGTRAPGDSPIDGGVNRLLDVGISYSASIDVNVDKNRNLRTKWLQIRGHLLTLASDFAGGGQVAVLAEDPSYDWHENKISATMSLVVTGQGSNIIEYRRSEDVDEQDLGTTFVDAWDGGDGFGTYEYPAPKRLFKTVSETVKRIKTAVKGLKAGRGHQVFTPANSGARFVPISRKRSTTPTVVGKLPDGFEVEEQSYIQMFRWSRAIKGSRPRDTFDPPTAAVQ